MTSPALPPRSPGSARDTRRRMRIALRVCAALLALWLILAYEAFYNPPLPSTGRADAVVVLGGAADERLDVGRALVDRGAAPRLVLSSTGLPGNARADAVCAEDLPDVTCFRPDPLTTRGEARSIGDLARDQGWDDIIVVTSTYHVTRSHLNISQCSKAEVTMAASEPSLNPGQWLARFIEESTALAASWLRPVCANRV
ncbi:YdcF family protein [Arthrobacter agilis]|uniref:YdcF family protein n=1 Tax=Arthrobacter agilis TaxID=37921 RepID=UPI002365F608|nr:YdcF family protein [Arthrobacter agilis]WDF32110.1 YdcF family protein [Arthrobacter agilis]